MIPAHYRLAQFNILLKDYMCSYNTTFHSRIDSTLLERYQNSKDHPRKPLSSHWLEDCFYNRITRKVRKVSTITINKVCYDESMQFISPKVDIRYLPDDMIQLLFCLRIKSSPSAGPTTTKTAIRSAVIRPSIIQRLEGNPNV